MASSVSTNTTIVNANTWQSVGVKPWADAFFQHSWEAMTQRGHTVDASETLSAAEGVAKTAHVACRESLATNDSVAKGMEVKAASGFELGDAEPVKDFSQELGERMAVTERLAKEVATEQADAFEVSSFEAKDVLSSNASTLGVADARPVFGIDQQIQEDVPVGEELANSVGVSLSAEGLSIAEKAGKRVEQENLSSLSVTDDDVAANSVESNSRSEMSITDLGVKDVKSVATESLGIGEVIAKALDAQHGSTFAVAESFIRSASFIRGFQETIDLDEVAAKLVSKLSRTSLGIAERMIVPAWMVIADITARELEVGQEYTHQDFLESVEKTAMPGWSQWRNFLHGDYEYSKAMFRVVMNSLSSDRAFLEECEVAVDVPDVIDRGSVRITEAYAATGVYVEFAREYHVIPEINLTARGGVGSNPAAAELMGSPTLLGFTARLRDTITGQPVAGTFSWSSIGY